MEEEIVRLLEEQGPLTGAELRAALGNDGFGQWKACMRSPKLEIRRVGRRYLRLDQKVEGYARLSPSILREFLTYSVVGLSDAPAALEARAGTLAARIGEITAAKFRLAQRIMSDIGGRLLGEDESAEDRFCVLLAGDVVYEMAHDAPRPERSTSRMVRGSDLDLVVIMDDQAPEELFKRLDDAIYEQKHRHLINPSIREEIDYVIKPFERLQEQAGFDTFKHMVSCKIVDEAVLLYGSERLFQAAKDLLVERHIIKELEAMQRAATGLRDEAERQLLTRDEDSLSGGDLYLFYTSEESEEFE
ncbi:MAG: hypothetical protein A2133_01155 [Actinobacteria bacterium RBG_16_64_13]|nr:MAG: hypothetical protein A2133_01155 [Actinobacteria bacterium RBG_16_64_13]